jgi:predicted TIM-barrel fold metal-dependent hydrolase
MEILSLRVVKEYLDLIKAITQGLEICDCHAHPFDIFSSKIKHGKQINQEGVYFAESAEFTGPKLSDLLIDDWCVRKRMSLFFKKTEYHSTRSFNPYLHTGPQVFQLQMTLSGVDKTLLLPVARHDDTCDLRFKEMLQIFSTTPQFFFGYSFPNYISNDLILAHLKDLVEQFDIKAVKIHPNLTQIDPSSSNGRSRIEHILEACGALNIPVIVHGGKSPSMTNLVASSYASIENLENIDWSLNQGTTILAHAGAYGSSYSELENAILPILKKLLKKHQQLGIDLSGLDGQAISLILKNVDIGKIFFGSDALYEPQWKVIVKLLHILKKTTDNYVECFRQITNGNPMNNIFKMRHRS